MCKRRLCCIVLILAISCSLSATGKAKQAGVSGQNAVTSETQVPQVVQSLKDKYGLPKPLPAVTSVVPCASTLEDLVNMQRQAYAQACVTSTFYDYRSVSKYRSRAGLHLGYDIAMPSWAEVRAGWPGTVVSIAPWYSNEWGVSVRSSNGTEVTYGHIVPKVRVGQTIAAGEVVGKVSVDHVDVKMRDKDGNYVPFGEKNKHGQPGVNASSFANVLPTNSRESLLVGWLVAQNALESAQQEMALRQKELKLAQIDRQRLEDRYASLHRQEVKLGQFLEQGLVARADVEKCQRDLNQVRLTLKLTKDMQKHLPLQIESAQHSVNNASRKLKSASQEAQQAGLSWKDVQSLVNKAVLNDKNLNRQVRDYKRSKDTKNDQQRLQLKREIAAQQERIVEYERIYEEGGLPRRTLEEAKERLQLLEEDLRRLNL